MTEGERERCVGSGGFQTHQKQFLREMGDCPSAGFLQRRPIKSLPHWVGAHPSAGAGVGRVSSTSQHPCEAQRPKSVGSPSSPTRNSPNLQVLGMGPAWAVSTL